MLGKDLIGFFGRMSHAENRFRLPQSPCENIKEGVGKAIIGDNYGDSAISVLLKGEAAHVGQSIAW